MGVAIARDAQLEWMQSLRPRIAHIELVFNDGSAAYRLLPRLTHLKPTKSDGVGPGAGYARSRPAAVKHTFAYDREILRLFIALDGFFSDDVGKEPWPELGDVDVVFLDDQGMMLGATVAHERMIIKS